MIAKGKVFSQIVILSLATLANIDVTDAGGSPHDVCEIYVDTFEVTYNETVAALNQAFNDAMDNILTVNMYIPPEDYLDQLNMIVLSWLDDNRPTLQAALDAAASLTGSTSDFIASLIEGSVVNPSSPVSCLYDMIIELNTLINNLFSALEVKSQLLADSQLVVGDHRPLLVSSSAV